jgi:GNAT superfamily N-acetyltransferase
MHATDLIHLQITLEYQLNPQGLLVPFPGSSEQARYIAYEYQDGFRQYFRHDLPAQVRARLIAAGPAPAFRQPELVQQILADHAPCPAQGAYASCYFTHRPRSDEFPQAQLREGCFVILVEGRPVAWAWSQRQNEACAEVAVETLPAFQRRGYARQVAAAWAAQVQESGHVAFYSYRLGNQASEALAHSLEVVHFAYCAAYE